MGAVRTDGLELVLLHPAQGPDVIRLKVERPRRVALAGHQPLHRSIQFFWCEQGMPTDIRDRDGFDGQIQTSQPPQAACASNLGIRIRL